MRAFILLCLTSAAFAAPQGYNYAPTAGSHGVVGGFASSSGPGPAGFAAPSIGGGFSGGHGVGGGFSAGPALGGGFSAGPAVGATGGFFNSGSGSGYQSTHGSSSHQQETVVTKRFFIHSAPEENDEDYKERHITVGVPKKNYNVVFIKSPSKSSKKTTLKITPAVNEEKTVVYVLTKKGDAHEVHTEVLEQPQPTSKPEVFFIKYNTHEEAQHAQEQIQSQYDALGGSSQVTDEGVAPVSSVIGSLGGHGGAGSANAGGHGAGAGFSGAHGSGSIISGGGSRGGSNAYLPPAIH